MERHIILMLGFTLLVPLVNCDTTAPPKIHGCGGYIRSQYKLEFNQIEIKLFTKQGSLKMKTDCAPGGNPGGGYYFIPLDRHGDYVLKVHSPEGWTFDPPQYEIKFDGKTDLCSKEMDLNFEFKGFSIFGNVATAGYSEGPSNVKLSLSGPQDLKLETMTAAEGAFSFESIPPGHYVIKATHPDILLQNDQYSFDITNKNIKIENKLLVSGYTVTGHVFTDSTRPVEGVYLVLFGEPTSKIPKQCLTNVPDININNNSDDGKLLCLRASSADGSFQFIGVSPGKYTIVPVYRGKNIIYDVIPEKLELEVKHDSLLLKTNFQVEGFTVQGTVPNFPGASVLVNGKVKAVAREDGTFALSRMKSGTYEFQVQAENVQFDPVAIEVSVLKPVLPDFVPSRFLVCGVVKGISSSSSSLTLNIQSIDSKSGKLIGDVRHENIQDPSNVCVFLPAGNYNAWIESSPNKYFTPSTYNFQVPNTKPKGFEFLEFWGKISGVIICKLGCPSDKYSIYLHRKDNGRQIQEKSLQGTSGDGGNQQVHFTFDNVESGTYLISLDVDNKYCWEKDGILEVTVKDSNVNNLSIIQNGFRLKVTSSHDTMLKILQQGQIVEKELSLKAKQTENICLKTAHPYTLKPTSCHIFDQMDISVQPGVNTEVMLQAIKHTISGKIISMEKIDDLKVKVNGNLLEGAKHITSNKNSRGEFEYRIEVHEVPNNLLTINIISLGFSFDRSEIELQTMNECQLDVFKITAKKAHILKGKLIPPLEGVQVNVQLLGESESTIVVQSDPKGEYIAGPFVHSSGFKVTPTLSGYIFKPTKEDPFSFTVHQLAKIQVKVEENPGEPLTNVLLSLSGPNGYRQNRYTNNGEMTFTDLQDGQYYLKALLKEFRFEPSAVNIDLKEQETKNILVRAKRESFSVYGQLYTLNGDLMPNLLISAKGTGNCAEYGEEGVSDEEGNFRIWALKSQCTYIISVSSGGEAGTKVERTIPSSLQVKVEQEDIKNLSFIVMTPVMRMDISLRCYTNKGKYLETLKAFVYSTRSPDIPVHKVSFNGYPYLILPQIHKDNTEYFITFESSLSEFQYRYKLPVINFVANESFAHFDFNFFVEPSPVEQDIGKSSYIAMICVFLVIIAVFYFEKISTFVRNYIENNSRKSKLKTK